MTFNTIAALKTGDTIIFQEIFHEYHERVYSYVLRKTKAPYIAEEATQLTFIKLWQYRNSLDEELAIDVQIFRIVRTTTVDLLRKQNKKRLQEAQKKATYSSNSVWEAVMARELNGKLILNMQAMPEVRKKVFEMSRMRGMSNKEIASSLSVSIKAVEFHISQALRDLKKRLL